MNESQKTVAADNQKREQEMTNVFERLPGTEMPERRSENVKHYDLGCGRYQMVVFPERVHYEEDGTWKEIDNTLIPDTTTDGRAVLRNRANPLKVEFAEDADDDKLVRIVADGKELSWSLDNADRDQRRRQARVLRETIRAQRALQAAEQQIAALEVVDSEGSMTESAAQEAAMPETLALQAAAQEAAMPETLALQAAAPEAVVSEVATASAAIIAEKEQALSQILKRCIAKATVMPNRLSAQAKRGEAVKARSEARYEDVAGGMNVIYRLEGDRFKEDIVLRDAAAISKAAIRLSDTYEYILNGDGSVHVMTKSGEATPFQFTAPVAWDAKGAELPVQVMLEAGTDYTRMRYTMASATLAAATFPVTIDPMVETTSGFSRASFKKGATTAVTTGYLKSGVTGSSNWATALKLNNINWDGMRASDTVTAAYLQLTDRTGKSANYVAAYRILEPWRPSTVTWDTLKCGNLGDNDNNRLDPVPLDCVKGAKKGHAISLNITRAYRSWKLENRNEGILICRPHMLTKANYMEFSAPTFYVNYISHAGLAGWWQYEKQGAGRAGVSNVDLFNGNLVHVHNDLQMNGKRMPIGVAHYYNSSLSAPNPGTATTETSPKLTNDFHCGRGFKLSAQQCIDWRKAGGSWFWVWTDGSSLEHWFKKLASGKTAGDLEGMGLKLVYTAKTASKLENITITDKSHTVMTFKRRQSGAHAQWHHYWLIEVKDSVRRKSGVYNRNSYSYQLPANVKDASAIAACEGMVSKITDSAGRAVNFVYDDARQLTQINWPGATATDGSVETRRVYFGYDENKRLSGIGYYDMQNADEGVSYQTAYSYENGLLTKVRNYDGQAVEIAYARPEEAADACHCGCQYCCSAQGDVTAQVKSLEFMAESTDGLKRGAKQLFDYGLLQTKVTAVENELSNKGKRLSYQFNDAGNVVSVLDELGFAQFAKFSAATPNQPTEVSKLMKVVVNHLKPFGTGGAWEQPAGGTAVIGYHKDANSLKNNSRRLLGVPTAKLPAYQVPAEGAPEGAEAATQIEHAVTLKRGEAYTLSAYVCVALPSPDEETVTDADVNAFVCAEVDGKVYRSMAADVEMMRQDNAVGLKGWARVSVSFTAEPGEGEAQARICLVNAGTKEVFFGWPQLERGPVANHVNLLDNADFSEDAVGGENEFRLPRSWKTEKDFVTDANNRVMNAPDDFPAVLEGRVMQIRSAPGQSKRRIFQTLPIAGRKNDVFTFGGWAKALSLPGQDAKAPYFDLAISFLPNKGTKYGKMTYLTFNKGCREWQFACRAVLAPGDYKSVRLYALYSQNADHVSFGNLFLSREEFGQSFGYDENKDVISATNRASEKIKIEYDDAKNIIKYRKPGKADSCIYTAKYGDTTAQRKEHLPRWTKTPLGTLVKYSYDDFGNVIKTRTFKSGESGDNNLCIGAVTGYTADGLFAVRSTDARGNTVTKQLDPKLGRVKQVTDPKGTAVSYEYDGADRVTKVSCKPEEAQSAAYQNSYRYENDRLREIRHNTGWNDLNDAPTGEVCYRFDYDALGRKTTVRVGEQKLSTNQYADDRSGLLKKVEYGNGGSVRYQHDGFDRLTGLYYDDEEAPRYSYTYDAEGRSCRVEDTNLNRRAWAEYDLAGRPIRSTQTEGTGEGERVLYRTRLGYGKDNNLKEFCETAGERNYKTKYSYDNDDRTTGLSYASDTNAGEIAYTYDKLSRISKVKRKARQGEDMKELTGGETSFFYLDGDKTRFGSSASTSLVQKLRHGSDAAKALNLDYTYDENGNITSLTQYVGTTAPEQATVRYSYDKLGQLIRVDDQTDPSSNTTGTTGTTWTYEYDLGGNILNKKRYAYTLEALDEATPIETNAYTYDAIWQDKLFSYNGRPVAYDAIGNPIRYNGTTYKWKAGRQLESMQLRTNVGSDGGNSGSGENGIDAQDGVDAISGTVLRIEYTNGNQIAGDKTETTAIARVYMGEREITEEFSEQLFKWTRTGGSATATEHAAWNAAHSGMRQISLTEADLSGNVKLTCTLTGTAGVYGSMAVDENLLTVTHTRGESDAGHTFRIVNGALVLDVPATEEAPLPGDPEAADEEYTEPVATDDGELADVPDVEGDATEPDVTEPEPEDDVGSGTYTPGEEEAADYENLVNDTEDPAPVDPDTLPDEDAIKQPKGINYILEGGTLKVNTGLNGELSAWATLYAEEPDQRVDFKYNANGLRVQKKFTSKTVVNNAEQTTVETTDYTLNGKLITHLTKQTAVNGGAPETEELHLFYDAQSRPAMVEYDGKLYIYVHNLQGDIIGMLDNNGNTVVKYGYNAWGAPLSTWCKEDTGDNASTLTTVYKKLAELNPFRYRGYVWDAEAGLYYLRSRYYSPVWGRFINSDITIGSIGTICSHNLFVYCANIPIVTADRNGRKFSYAAGSSYLDKYWSEYNPTYKKLDNDCANFASQYLNACGLKQTKKWKYTNFLGIIKKNSPAWGKVSGLYDFLREDHGLTPLRIESKQQWLDALEGGKIHRGQVMFNMNPEGTAPEHAMIVGDVFEVTEGGAHRTVVGYYGHTNSRTGSIDEYASTDFGDTYEILVSKGWVIEIFDIPEE